MATLSQQDQIAKILAPFQPKKSELEAKRGQLGHLRAEADNMRREALEAKRAFNTSVRDSEHQRLIAQLESGTVEPRLVEVQSRKQLMEELCSRAEMSFEAAANLAQQLSIEEHEFAGQCQIALLPVWQACTAELHGALAGVTRALERIGQARDLVHSAEFRGVNCPLSPGLFVPMRVDEESAAKRWFRANANLGLVDTKLLERVA